MKRNFRSKGPLTLYPKIQYTGLESAGTFWKSLSPPNALRCRFIVKQGGRGKKRVFQIS